MLFLKKKCSTINNQDLLLQLKTMEWRLNQTTIRNLELAKENEEIKSRINQIEKEEKGLEEDKFRF